MDLQKCGHTTLHKAITRVVNLHTTAMGDVSNGHVYITTEQMNYKAKLSHFTKQYLQWSIYTLTPMADVSNTQMNTE